MKRILFLILIVILPQYAVAANDNAVATGCATPVRDSATQPMDEYTILRIDSELRLLESSNAIEPKQGLQTARSIAAEIQRLPNRRLRSLLDGQLAPTYMKLNQMEAAQWLGGIPSRAQEGSYYDNKALAYSAAIGTLQDSSDLKMELVSSGLAGGAFQIAQLPVLLQMLQTEDSGRAAVLFRQAIAAFPVNAPSDLDIRFLLRLTQIIMATSNDDAAKGITLMIAALHSSRLQSAPLPVMPMLHPIQATEDQNANLKVEVKRLAMKLNVDDEDDGQRQAPPRRAGNSGGMGAQIASYDGKDAVRSAAFQSAVKSLGGNVSDEDVLQLASSIDDRAERTQFFVLVLRKMQGKPGSVAHLAGAVLSGTEGSDDPQLSLAVPRTVLQAALLANDQAAAQLAMASFSRGATATCKDSRIDDDNAGFVRGSACIAEYRQMAAEIAKSPMRGSLQMSDPSLIERLNSGDTKSCRASTHPGKPAR
jgi:hypothetical protein